MTETNKLDILIEQLGQLTVVEAGQLAKQLEKEWDLDLANLTAGAPAAIPPSGEWPGSAAHRRRAARPRDARRWP